jgi:serine/threonine protein kinase
MTVIFKNIKKFGWHPKNFPKLKKNNLQKYFYNLGQSADIWSLGILLYTLLCGCFPFRAMSEKELYSKITKGVYNFPEHMSSASSELLRKLLSLEPSQRPQVEEILADPWVNTGNNFLLSSSNYFSAQEEKVIKLENISIVEQDFNTVGNTGNHSEIIKLNSNS